MRDAASSQPAAAIDSAQALTLRHTPGRGPYQFIMVPGLVPDGPETFLRQIKTLRAFGALTTVTYPYDRFDLDAALAEIRRLIDDAHRHGRRPVLMGVSVGGGLCLELLRRARAAGDTIPLSALILVSPLSCTGDLAPLLARLVDGIFSEFERGADGDPEAALERGRTFFKTLASRSVNPRPLASGWRSLFSLLTPQGLAELGERRIRARIESTLAAIPAHGGLARVMALRQLPGIAGPSRGPLTGAPTLMLWGSKERHTLNMDGPGAALLCRPDLASKLLPDCEVHWLYGADGETVPHASLLKHAPAFNRHLRAFMQRLAKAESAKLPLFARGSAFMQFGLARSL